jgi:hypothetical protein
MSGLVQARNLAAAAAGPADVRRSALARFAATWDEEIVHHFADEERMLAGLLSSESLTRLVTEHRQLRELAEVALDQAAATEPDPDMLRRLGTLLHDHIRWEEREAFGEAEAAAGPADFEALGRDAAAIEHARPGARPRLRL